jgi:hypothetical protein
LSLPVPLPFSAFDATACRTAQSQSPPSAFSKKAPLKHGSGVFGDWSSWRLWHSLSACVRPAEGLSTNLPIPRRGRLGGLKKFPTNCHIPARSPLPPRPRIALQKRQRPKLISPNNPHNRQSVFFELFHLPSPLPHPA